MLEFRTHWNSVLVGIGPGKQIKDVRSLFTCGDNLFVQKDSYHVKHLSNAGTCDRYSST